MSAADSARLELAKRAYQATQPSVVEVQTGVRRARLALRRPKQRRKWLMKGLVFVVLALGSLAWAKPHALGELVERGLPLLGGGDGKQRAALIVPREAPPAVPSPVTPATPSAPTTQLAPAPTATEATAREAPAAEPSARSSKTKARPGAVSARPELRQAPVAAQSGVESASASASSAPGAQAVSEWGRVGQALASGDQTGALSALSKLSESEDPRTRDKADLGRAQLLMSHGNRDQACSLARSLTRRRAGGHIERQALMLLKDCAR
ncbi:MAG: hypothetical protein EOO73_32935 [Myxococcales bacterium]|nr:MAG: hypothetical protein EOO73_32935 [Myxococcales bacterium]